MKTASTVMKMAKKSGIERIADAARNVKAIKDIVKAFMQGSWSAAAMQALKHYWPQILTVSIILFLLPVIIFCCLPAMLFGFETSADTEIASINLQANTISNYYDRYEEYCDDRVDEIEVLITEEDSENESKKTTYEVITNGEAMDMKWFISLHSVSFGNDLNVMNEQNIKEFVTKTILYTVENKPKETGNAAETASVEENNTKVLTIKYLTPLEFMSEYKFTESDINWAQLMYRTLQEETTSDYSVLGTPFEDPEWRNCITSEYGYRIDPEPGFHKGLDIGKPLGTEILAVKSGTVKTAENGTAGYGNYIVIDHGNGLETIYAHCSELLSAVGDEVDAGKTIAKVGSTGDSTGPHLHIEIRLNGETVDPFAYLS